MLLRWAHVVVALVWIGTSFYLISWENKFNRERGLRDGVDGDFLTIQGGDFYFVEKLSTAPQPLPDRLHWFKFEAYFTWLTGFALMCIYYYANAPAMLLAPDSPVRGTGQAIAASLGLLVGSWLVYTAYCRTSLARNYPASAALGMLFITLLSWLSDWLFSGRAGMLHVGAALGSIMSANVFFVIIPWQKRLLLAVRQGAATTEILREHPGFRSRHNHYLALPVLFLMLGTHAPINFESPYAWLVGSLLVLSLGLFKHFHTRIQRSQSAWAALAAGVVVFVYAVALDLAYPARPGSCDEPVPTDQAVLIVDKHCASCHSSGQAPMLGAPQQWLEQKDRFRERVLRMRTMPPASASTMTSAERETFGCWLAQQEGS